MELGPAWTRNSQSPFGGGGEEETEVGRVSLQSIDNKVPENAFHRFESVSVVAASEMAVWARGELGGEWIQVTQKFKFAVVF